MTFSTRPTSTVIYDRPMISKRGTEIQGYFHFNQADIQPIRGLERFNFSQEEPGLQCSHGDAPCCSTWSKTDMFEFDFVP
ncbi:MAG: hypothetical protein CMJ32_04485 [Phycisphaerae bacterium]|nr:hypothetical protein [Phycisphaerae bacterium]